MDPNKPYHLLRAKTGRTGLREQPSAEYRKRRAEETEVESKYVRFDSFERSREDNLRYARAYVTIKVEETIALSSLSVNDENITPTTPPIQRLIIRRMFKRWPEVSVRPSSNATT